MHNTSDCLPSGCLQVSQMENDPFLDVLPINYMSIFRRGKVLDCQKGDSQLYNYSILWSIHSYFINIKQSSSPSKLFTKGKKNKNPPAAPNDNGFFLLPATAFSSASSASVSNCSRHTSW